MFQFLNKSIRAKLVSAITINVICLIVVCVTFFTLVNSLIGNLNSFSNAYLPSLSDVLNADRDLYQARVGQMDYVTLQGDKGALNDYQENAQQALDRMYGYQKRLSMYPEIQAKLSSFDTVFNQWKSSSQQVINLVDEGKYDEAKQLLSGDNAAKFGALRDLYDAAGEMLENIANSEMELAQTSTAKIEKILVGITVVMVLISALIGYFVPKFLVDAIKSLTQRVIDIKDGDGDLTQRINSNRVDELGHLAESFDDFIARLQRLIGQISQNTNELSSAAHELDTTYGNGQQITNDTSQGIEMIATAVNQFSVSVREVASHAENAAHITNSTAEVTKQGALVIEQSSNSVEQLELSISGASTVIENLEEESTNIVSVLDVIRNIAEQTNLLALNAAIEAARAGEQGRGFAVVADEVRSLASKTQHSTEEIQQMIDKLQAGVKEAVHSIHDGSTKVALVVEQAHKTQELFTQIQSFTDEVSDMASQIAAATEEQSSTSEELNSNITLLNEKNRTFQELSEQIHSVAGRVNGLSTHLTNDVKSFVV